MPAATMAIPSELGSNWLLECLRGPHQETHDSRQLSEHLAASRQPSKSASREACAQELVLRRGWEAMVARVVGSDGHSWLKYGQKQVKGSSATRCYYRCARAKSISRCQAKKTVDITCSSEPLSLDAIQVTHRCRLHNHLAPPLRPIHRPPTPHVLSSNPSSSKCVNKVPLSSNPPAYRTTNHLDKRPRTYSPEDLHTGRASDWRFNLAASHGGVCLENDLGISPAPNAIRPCEPADGLNAMASDFGAPVSALSALGVDSVGAMNIPTLQNVIRPCESGGGLNALASYFGAALSALGADTVGALNIPTLQIGTALLHSPRQEEQLSEFCCLPEWDFPPLSPLPTHLHSSPPCLAGLIPVKSCSTDLNGAAAVDTSRSKVSLESCRSRMSDAGSRSQPSIVR
ncbi:unnamed protein product [Closterium sp. Yama58-4]|nr:unnamed protein product [Closterium sp. Yama58-4]